MRRLNILHFNDVYHLSPRKQEPVGGAARFATVVKEFRNRYDLDTSCVFFSGDVFNPSVESSVSKGKHMVPVMNDFTLDVSCFGNHDFDFGLPTLSALVSKTNFPWVLSNVIDSETGGPLAGGKRWHILEKSGLKIAILGLVEKEWLETIPNLPSNVKHLDYVTVGKELATLLRDPKGHGVDLVIALSHSRLPNDIILAKQCRDEIDLVLGGHDHFYYVGKGCEVVGGWERDDPGGSQEDDGIRLVKSGTDFRELSILEIDIEELDNEDGGTIKVMKNVFVTRKEITSAVVEDPHVLELVSQETSSITQKLTKPIAYTATPWDCRSTTVRAQESAFGNFVADLMLYAYAPCISYNIDCALLCGGTIRSDTLYQPGEITYGDLLEIFPFEDTVVVIRITGQQLWDALENGLSKVPKQEGRFPIVSGLKIVYDPKAEPGHRLRNVWLTERRPPTPTTGDTDSTILENVEDIPQSTGSLSIIGELDMQQIYTMCTRSYMAKGFDGFKSLALPTTEYLVDDENGIILSTLIHRYFIGLYYVSAMRFNKSHKESTQEVVLKAVASWKKLTEKKATALQHGHLSKLSICDALKFSMGEKISVLSNAFKLSLSEKFSATSKVKETEVVQEEEKVAIKKQTKKDWVTVAPVIEDRIVSVES